MPVISFVSSKGGVGKTTSAVVLAGEFAAAGRKVVLIDADPNRPLDAWSRLKGLPETLRLMVDDSAETIIDTIEEARTSAVFVIVDLEGTATDRIGFAIAQAMARAGARLAVSDVDGARLNSACSDLHERAPDKPIFATASDLAVAASRRELVETVLDTCGTIDILVSNAGIQGKAGPLSDIDEAAFQEVMEVNLRAAIDLSAMVFPSMVANGGGSIILIASIAGIRGNKTIGLYGLSKAALAQLARNLAVEWGPSNVRVNSISPGLIRTPFATQLMEDPVFMERRLGLTPLRRAGEPEDIAGVAVMLASRAGGFITGQNIVVDGGTTISDGS